MISDGLLIVISVIIYPFIISTKEAVNESESAIPLSSLLNRGRFCLTRLLLPNNKLSNDRATAPAATSAINAASAAASATLGSEKACHSYSGLPANWQKDPYAYIIKIKGGSFDIGSENAYSEEFALKKPPPYRR